MGLEEHLLHMFRDDFEFHDEAGPSHHGGAPRRRPVRPRPKRRPPRPNGRGPPRRKPGRPSGCPMPRSELKKIPFFVRGKAKRNTEKFAPNHGCAEISRRTLVRGKGPLCAIVLISPATASRS
jgi:light-independent protochlorophyllide reductase subunit B